jgi:hypothetical protein
MVGWLAEATMPAEFEASESIAVRVGTHVVLEAEAAAGVMAGLAPPRGNARVLPTLRLTTDLRRARSAEGEGNRPGSEADASATTIGATDDRQAMRAVAARISAEAPAVEVERAEVPHLAGNPVDDARQLFGLTVVQLASLLGVTERQVYRFDPARMPAAHRERLNALVALGLLLVGGLGPDGAKRWLDAGEPTGAQLLREGKYGALRSRSEELKDSVAT